MSASNDLFSLERELAQLKEQLPAHSIPPSLLQRIDELEEEIAALKIGASSREALDQS